MQSIKLTASFFIHAINAIIAVLYYAYTEKNLAILPENFYTNALLLLLVLNLLMMVLMIYGSEKKNKETKVVEIFEFKDFTVEVGIVLTKVYEILKKYDEINYADIYFYEEDKKYRVKIKTEIKDQTEVNVLSSDIREKIQNLFVNEYGYNDIPVDLAFMMSGGVREIIPKELKEEIETNKERETKKQQRKKPISKKKNKKEIKKDEVNKTENNDDENTNKNKKIEEKREG